MIVGALVLVEVTAGITEASMTRSPSSPCTRSPLSTTAIAWLANMQVQLAWYQVPPLRPRTVAGWSRSIPERAVANRFE
jgi:hypothetical protein